MGSMEHSVTGADRSAERRWVDCSNLGNAKDFRVDRANVPARIVQQEKFVQD